MTNSTTCGPILLADRGVLRVSGPQVETFLQDLVSNDVTTLTPGEGRYAALLTPNERWKVVGYVAGKLQGSATP